jgi:hypothetical protein
LGDANALLISWKFKNVLDMNNTATLFLKILAQFHSALFMILLQWYAFYFAAV